MPRMRFGHGDVLFFDARVLRRVGVGVAEGCVGVCRSNGC